MTDHHRRDVLLGEDPLDGDDIGMMRVQPVLDGVADGRLRLSTTDSPQRVNPGSTPSPAPAPPKLRTPVR
jgi:hypothetical protein